MKISFEVITNGTPRYYERKYAERVEEIEKSEEKSGFREHNEHV